MNETGYLTKLDNHMIGRVVRESCNPTNVVCSPDGTFCSWSHYCLWLWYGFIIFFPSWSCPSKHEKYITGSGPRVNGPISLALNKDGTKLYALAINWSRRHLWVHIWCNRGWISRFSNPYDEHTPYLGMDKLAFNTVMTKSMLVMKAVSFTWMQQMATCSVHSIPLMESGWDSALVPRPSMMWMGSPSEKNPALRWPSGK